MQYKSKPSIFAICYSLFRLVSMYLIEGGFTTYPLSTAQSGESKGTGVGSWIPLSLSANVESTVDPPEARTEAGGAVVRLRGSVQIKAAKTIKQGELVAVLPVATPSIRPAAAFRDSIGISAPTGTRTYTVFDCEITSNGEVKYQGTAELPAATVIVIDGITFYVS